MGHELNFVNMMNGKDGTDDDSDLEVNRLAPDGKAEVRHSSGQQV